MTSEEAVFKLADGIRDSPFAGLLLRSGVTASAILDAGKLKGDYEVFEALNDSFRFPVYFGWNWDALYDCLADLTWIPADRYLVVIESAQYLDVSGNESHRLLVRTLQRASRSFSASATDARRGPVGFSVLLSRSDGDKGLVRRFHEIGVELEELA